MPSSERHHNQTKTLERRPCPFLELMQLPAPDFADPRRTAWTAPNRTARLNPIESAVIDPLQQIDLLASRGPKAMRYPQARGQCCRAPL